MPRVFICTQGTSIANKLTNLRELQKEDFPWDSQEPMAKAFNQALDKKSTEWQRLSCTELAKESAELTILNQRKLTIEDRVILIATDTFLGNACSRVLRQLLLKHWRLPEGNVQIRRIEGLQVTDGERFKRNGIGNFLEGIRKEVNEARKAGYEVFLCPNGGFKGIVPFMTFVGMLNHCKVLYTFEQTKTVLELPSLPFSLDISLYRRAEAALQHLEAEVELPKEVFLNEIVDYSPSEESLFLGFVQQTDDGTKVTPNSLLASLLEAQVAENTGAMLSKDARQDLEKIGPGPLYDKFTNFILRSQNPDYRDNNLHPLETTNLYAMKRIQTGERLLGYPVDTKFYVARVLQHDEYDRLTTGSDVPQKADYPLSCFSRWEPTQAIAKTPKGRSELSALCDENAALREQLAVARSEVAAQKHAVDEAQDSLIDLQEKFEDHSQTLQHLESQNATLQDDNAKLREQLENLPKTFMQRLRHLFHL